MCFFTSNRTKNNSAGPQALKTVDQVLETSDQVLLARTAIEDASGKIGEICVKERISDPTLLEKVAIEAKSGAVRQFAVRHAYFKNAGLLEKIATRDPDAAVRTTAVESAALSDPDALARIASAPHEEGFLEPRWTAALKLASRDPDRAAPLLLDILCDETAQDRTWLFNETLNFLDRYCRGADDPKMKEAIESVLKRHGRV